MAKLTSTEYASISDLSTAGGDVGRGSLIPLDTFATQAGGKTFRTTSASVSALRLFEFGRTFHSATDFFAKHSTSFTSTGLSSTDYSSVNNAHAAVEFTTIQVGGGATEDYAMSYYITSGFQNTQTTDTNSAYITPTIYYAQKNVSTASTQLIDFSVSFVAYTPNDTIAFSTSVNPQYYTTILSLPASTSETLILKSYTATTIAVQIPKNSEILYIEIANSAGGGDHNQHSNWYFLGMGLTWSRP